MGQLEGRVALVTGASRGIGAAIAKRFGAEGAKVAITARTLDQHDHLDGSLLETAKAIEALGGTAIPIVGDLADPSCLDAIVEQTERELGSIDVLVNNAAAAFYLPFTKTSEKRFRVANDINFFAPWRLSQLVVPGMQERREGWILNISSATSDRPTADTFKDFDALSILYGSTKAALERFTAGLAAAVHKDGIWVNSMAPVGAVPTEGTEALGVVPDEALAVAESREAMAEASLALCTTRDPKLTARITLCTPILEELRRDVFLCDGKTRVGSPRESDAAKLR
ncbi:MAG: SDR family NAD(P)-dependent oxidoreductase [bacterium]|nr:SDR family NAD(P)-dependent oxidoreductase [bacterium]